ncbi:MAG: hexitol phosphatase HxpB [Candidatus Dormibacteria bacterium]
MTAAGDPSQPLRAVIFDMDGVLIDTEPVWREVEIEVFARVGLHLTEDDCRSTMGLRVDEVVGAWYGRHPWTGPTCAEVANAIVDGVVATVRLRGEAMPGVAGAFAAVRSLGLHCAVASSSSMRLIEAVMERLELNGAVDVVRSAEHEAAGKPAPDVYLSTARELGVAPQSCLAVEDSVNGWLSATAAGMPCVVVPDAEVGRDPRLARAPLVLSSLSDLDAGRIDQIARDYFA